ncbi:MAG: vWA domain-containing protein [Myxococcota bacterium]
MRWIGLACALLLFPSCVRQDFRVVVPESAKETKLRIDAKLAPADILFIVDNSASMADEQENLAQNFQAFIEALAAIKTGDYQIGIVTTDLDSVGNERSGLVSSVFHDNAPFALDHIDGSLCAPTEIPHGCFRGADPAGRIIRASQPIAEQVASFQANVRVGSCGSGNEQGLEAMRAALLNAAPGACNQGFLRPGAELVVIIVSDEDDTTLPGHSARPIQEYVDFLVGLKGDPRLVRVAAIVGSADQAAHDCNLAGATCSQSCSAFNAPGCCSALAGSRYVALAEAAGAGVSGSPVERCGLVADGPTPCLVDSICQTSFANTLERIATDLIGPGDRVNISPPAKYPPGVVVELNGVALENCAAPGAGPDCDFTVSADGTSLWMKRSPGPGDSVQVFAVVQEP